MQLLQLAAALVRLTLQAPFDPVNGLEIWVVGQIETTNGSF